MSSEVEGEDAKAQDPLEPATPQPPPVATPAGTGKKRGRPKRIQNQSSPDGGGAVTPKPGTPQEEANSAVKSRRVQLLRKRLAIDMVSVGQEQADMKAKEKESSVGVPNARVEDGLAETLESPKTRDHRPLRATRRTTTSTNTNLQPTPKSTRKRQSKASVQQSQLPPPTMAQFGSSESESNNNNNSSISFALSAQIDLTMCSSSSSTSSGAAANQQVIGGSGSSSMLPPTTILSSSDPLPDVIFQPNDFSSIMATQQLRSSRPSSISCGSTGGSQPDCHDEDNYTSALDNSGGKKVLLNPLKLQVTKSKLFLFRRNCVAYAPHAGTWSWPAIQGRPR